MVHKIFIRLLAVLLVLPLLLTGVSASSAGERLAVERSVFEYLTTELKLSTAAACGILANIEHESAFQPTIVGDKGTSYGLCQWHNERFTALRGYCAALGLDYRTVEGQLAYLKYELGTNYSTLLLTLQSLENTPDGAYRAGFLWCIHFEMPSDMNTKALERGELARNKYWVRYRSYQQSIIILPEPEEPELSPEALIEQLRQNPVTIPQPPQMETEDAEGGHRFVFERPEFRYYIPRNLPATEPVPEQEETSDLSWGIPALIAIGIAMVIVILFPTKKTRQKVYRRGKVMV